jgi:transcription elongation factor Elf1
MSDVALPAVAKSIFTACKKCGEDRYHTVIAHTSATAAKVKCEICGASKSFKTPSAKAAKKKPSTPRVKKNAHLDEYSAFMSSHSNKDSANYSMKGKFETNQKVQHPKFGLGFVRTSFTDKIEVVFEDEVRSLIHNRTN